MFRQTAETRGSRNCHSVGVAILQQYFFKGDEKEGLRKETRGRTDYSSFLPLCNAFSSPFWTMRHYSHRTHRFVVSQKMSFYWKLTFTLKFKDQLYVESRFSVVWTFKSSVFDREILSRKKTPSIFEIAHIYVNWNFTHEKKFEESFLRELETVQM